MIANYTIVIFLITYNWLKFIQNWSQIGTIISPLNSNI